MDQHKRRRGDRRDGVLLRELDSLHYITGIIYPNRCDNEAYVSLRIDLTAMNEYLARKNETEKDFPYTMFHLIVAALLKTITLRPKMNRFIVNSNFYQRNEVSAAFVVKKQFSDNGRRGAGRSAREGRLHRRGRPRVHPLAGAGVPQREGRPDDRRAWIYLNKIPRFISKAAIRFLMWLDKHGWVPKDIIATDPYYNSVVISNLGSIKLKCGYHHLTNWGTCSMFCIIGEKKKTAFFDENGIMTMRETLDLGLTIDERLADGYYYSKSVRLLKYLLEHPEELEKPIKEEVDYE